MADIHFASDLHLDVGKSLPEFPGGEILVLAGDTCEARQLRRYEEDKHGFLDPGTKVSNKDRINGFLHALSEKYQHVIMVPGNHEHYHNTFSKTIPHMKANVPDNFHVLNNDVFELDDVLFIGSTLWTDCNNQCPMTRHVLKYGMNDFKYVRVVRRGSYVRFTPDDSIIEHIDSVRYIRTILSNPANDSKKVVIVTHHAPTHLSIAPEYRGDYEMNGGYYTDLSELILDHTNIKYWIHGHTHTKFDYMVGDHTRVLCNPRGYQLSAGVRELTGWDPTQTLHI